MTLGSLFDGSGTCPLAATMCGIKPVWASEIEPYPIRVTRKNFPEMLHLGDITQINGAEIEPVDIVAFGSPCQGLSVAGCRASPIGGRTAWPEATARDTRCGVTAWRFRAYCM